ncbi:hypothetical protein WKR88_02080 [Trinickia caryophylli]|uniref:Uncharacterized protein n=1 Tax=Trinickia caryophylli TaxID=28094 RepID=A0A1X7CL08_TRICW|nr:hypothetical protein [Trinickia caryophylli]TRX20019.1 hypothetical protein FNF07_18655 [Trinickia caryophylli]WQE12636.1 hypothetical protein U0034_04285 [Trinickia caryophylli]GLU30338.1 hypothetical protein Busp01_01800 [Trinickia caryophylli]SME98602.1 hypothetical protein SAMN06295900_101552 [Trinickia caryophylli]
MSITAFKHLLRRVLHLSAPPARERLSTTYPAPTIPLDPFWHGDHWQNLLASPMDARHYVMEDWAVPPGDALDAPRAAWSKDSRSPRRSH